MTTIRQYLLIIIAFSCTAVQAQEAASDGPLTIGQQFTEMVDGSNSYQDFKVIKKTTLNTVQANIKKRIDGLQEEISTLKGEIATQKTKIGELTQSLGNTEATLTATNEEKDSMNFFGTLMSKSAYSTMMWSIVGILLLGLVFFIYRFKNSNAVTKESRYKLDEVEADFDEYRKMALEKEQKLGRQLQDERNKLLKASKG